MPPHARKKPARDTIRIVALHASLWLSAKEKEGGKSYTTVNKSIAGIKHNKGIVVVNIKEREDITDVTVNEGIAVIKGGPTTIVTAAAEAKLDKESQSKEDEDWEDSWEMKSQCHH